MRTVRKSDFAVLGPVVRSLVSANRWLRGIKTYRFPWYLTLVSANHASSNPGLFYICYNIAFPLTNMPDTVKSLRKSNNDLKRQLEAAKRDFKKLEDRFQAHEAVRCEEYQNGGASCSLNIEVQKSLDFLGKEYDDLSNSDADTKREFAELDEIGVRLEEMAGILDELEEYSYSFNVKLLGVPQLSADENAVQTSNLCVKIFNKMGANVSINNLDIAHRVSTRSATREGPKAIVCRFKAAGQK